MAGDGMVDETGDMRIRPFAALLVAGTVCSVGVLGMQAASAARGGAMPPAAADTTTTPAPTTTATPIAARPTPTPAAQVSAVQQEAAVEGVAAEGEGTPAAPLDAPRGAAASALVQAPVLVHGPEQAADLMTLMNGARQAEGLPPLERDPGLEGVAEARAGDMLARGYFDHYSPAGESAFTELSVRGIGYRLAGENLARNNYPEERTVAAAFEGLMASPGHRANILEPRFTHAGVVAVRQGRLWLYVTVFTD